MYLQAPHIVVASAAQKGLEETGGLNGGWLSPFHKWCTANEASSHLY